MAHLRKDNDGLRQALVEAQREAEDAVLEKESNKEAGAIDFGHLLALAKDFGDGLGGGLGETFEETTGALDSVQCFSLDSPRDCNEGASSAEAEELRRQLEESRREVEQLRALLAAKDAELAAAHLVTAS